MLRKYVEQILSLYNYIDGLMITDDKGKIEYYVTYRPDLVSLREKDVIGKYLLDIYPDITEETSSIMRVLKTGRPIFNEEQEVTSFKGETLHVVNTTMPIMENGRIVGAIDVSRYNDPAFGRQNISLSFKDSLEPKSLYTVDDIIGNSNSMAVLKERIPMIASTDSSVLIYGETGAGKELVAQSIHTASHRKSKRFVSQNCAAIPSNLLEGILFGTVKGSFTGAENKPGLFEIANGGTLFLDEINSMDVGLQSKILKAIEDKKVTRVGGYEPIATDIKIISAVNQNPLTCVQEGKLREDLFYRLSVVQLNVPPLRERHEDLLLLTDYFIKEYNSQMKKDIMGLDEEAETILKAYTWPGNVRELRNVIEGAFNVASNRFIRRRDLPEYLLDRVGGMSEQIFNPSGRPMPKIDQGFSLDKELEEFEKAIILQALNKAKNYTDAAELLGISKQSLNYKMKKYMI